MTFQLKPEDTVIIDQAIQAGLIRRADDVVGVGVDALRSRLGAHVPPGSSARHEAVRRLQEFGDKYRLDLGEQIIRDLLHEGHRH
jgi:hypothetical protein